MSVAPTGLSPCAVRFPTRFGLPSMPCCKSSNPGRCPLRFRLLRFRSPLLAECFLFLRLMRCFSSPGSLRSRGDGRSFHRVSPFGHQGLFAPAHGSSLLFAVYHVLHRHLMPRHPPHTLTRLRQVLRRSCGFRVRQEYVAILRLHFVFVVS